LVASRRQTVGTCIELRNDVFRRNSQHGFKIRQTDRKQISDWRSKIAILAVPNPKNMRKTGF